MKHVILINAFLFVACLRLAAQQAYFSISASWCKGTNGVTHSMFEQSRMEGNQVTMSSKRLYLGEGFNYRADFRYFFNDNIGIGLQGTLVRGKWQKFHSEKKIVYIQHKSQSCRANGVSVAAALHVRANENILMPYFSLSPGLFTGNIYLVDTVSYPNQITTSTWKYPSLISWHINFAAGVDIMLNEELCLFLETEFQNMTLSPTRAKLLMYNGSTELENLPVGEKEVHFLDEVSTDNTQQPDKSLPQQSLRPYFPLNNFQIRLGFRILLTRN